MPRHRRYRGRRVAAPIVLRSGIPRGVLREAHAETLHIRCRSTRSSRVVCADHTQSRSDMRIESRVHSCCRACHFLGSLAIRRRRRRHTRSIFVILIDIFTQINTITQRAALFDHVAGCHQNATSNTAGPCRKVYPKWPGLDGWRSPTVPRLAVTQRLAAISDRFAASDMSGNVPS
jgi:hypothetical protein